MVAFIVSWDSRTPGNPPKCAHADIQTNSKTTVENSQGHPGLPHNNQFFEVNNFKHQKLSKFFSVKVMILHMVVIGGGRWA